MRVEGSGFEVCTAAFPERAKRCVAVIPFSGRRNFAESGIEMTSVVPG